ncbi:PDZ domain-containing protein [Gracilibacillus ureilyticus]|uniref:endopeptidase La n=1 Tax=Gracilibacillus ureilyticus TaxID=531814 RepID=A0A1H9TIJ0_9BACI|nr:SepM family pheromone-processing serine protease [Gracilibacillus ureilyticus]SER96794.1 PDZ domain-containing protein [Gracilibacillus ureilyticus]
MKKQWLSIASITVLAILCALFFVYELPYYIYKPGSADALNPIVKVEGGYESEGDMHLVTIQGGQATPFYYLMAKLRDYHQVVPIEEVYHDGISQEDFKQMQLMMMESSQEASTVVAYEAAKAEIEIQYNGVYVVSVIEDMPAAKVLQTGDRIIEIDGMGIAEANDLIDFVTTKQVGDRITLTIIRGEEQMKKSLTLAELPENNKPGIGIQLVTDREVNEEPELTFSSGDIGGPSAGLMFALEIYDQLTEEDLTKGHQIAGTGEIDYEGNVGRIGGIDKKVIAADREGNEIFFAPNEGGREDSNYQTAKEVAENINTDMKIIPVDTFDEAIQYLQSLE